jgi:recombinational DNA repair ATPase RecF
MKREATIVSKYKELLSEKNEEIKDLKREIEDLEYVQEKIVEELEDIRGSRINTNDYLKYR